MNHLNLTNPLLVMMTLPGHPTHHAPSVSLSSFKSHCFAAVAAASLLTSALPADAIAFRVVEDSSTRFAFNVAWDEEFRRYSSYHQWFTDPVFGGVSDDTNGIFITDVRSYVWSPGSYFTFRIDFSRGNSPDRVFEVGDVVGFTGTEALAFRHNDYGAKFVYGAARTDVVPDHGSTALLLGVGLTSLMLGRRTLIRSIC